MRQGQIRAQELQAKGSALLENLTPRERKRTLRILEAAKRAAAASTKAQTDDRPDGDGAQHSSVE